MSENDSDWTRVRVVEYEEGGWGPASIECLEHEDADPQNYYIARQTIDALAKVVKGDIVEVIFDPTGWIVRARRITGTLRGRVEALEQALKAAGIPIPPNTLEKP